MANNPIYYIDPDGRGVFPSQEELRKAGQQVVSSSQYQPTINDKGGVTTYCNLGTQAIMKAAGDETLLGLANDMGQKLRDTEFATPLTAQKALDYANKGVTVIASWVNPNPKESGHVAVVAPGEKLTYDDIRKENTVMIFNVGKTNGEVNLGTGFGTRDVGFFILNADLNTLNSNNSVQNSTISNTTPASTSSTSPSNGGNRIMNAFNQFYNKLENAVRNIYIPY